MALHVRTAFCTDTSFNDRRAVREDSKMIECKNPFSAKTRQSRRFLLAALSFCILASLIAPAVHAGARIKETGKLISIEPNDAVIIDGKGYLVDPEAQVFNSRRQRCSLTDLKLPTKVEFEFEYTNRGPVIKRIRERPS